MSMFLQYGNVKGECNDENHKQWLDVEYIKWEGVKRKITSSSSTHKDRESSNAVIKNIDLVRRVDKATPYVFMESCCGTGVDAKIAMTKTGYGSGTDVFMLYTLKNVLITNYIVFASSQSNARPLERISLSFVDMQMKYMTYDDNGIIINPVAVGFNTATNQKA